ncbi:MAG: SPOR domain-containing protein, partial [Flavobacteriaceae bacterium]
TFDLGALDQVDLNLEALPEVAEQAVMTTPYFSVIAGSYRSIDNAEKKLAQLKANGYDAAFTEINPEGLHRVAYGRFN